MSESTVIPRNVVVILPLGVGNQSETSPCIYADDVAYKYVSQAIREILYLTSHFLDNGYGCSGTPCHHDCCHHLFDTYGFSFHSKGSEERARARITKGAVMRKKTGKSKRKEETRGLRGQQNASQHIPARRSTKEIED